MRKTWIILGLVVALALSGCERSTGREPWRPAGSGSQNGQGSGAAVQQVEGAQQVRAPGDPVLTPTPDPPRVLPTPRQDTVTYQRSAGGSALQPGRPAQYCRCNSG